MSINQHSNTLQFEGSEIPSWVSAQLNSKKLREFVSVDVETNGLKPSENSILSIAAVRFLDGEPIAHFYSQIKPVETLPSGKYNTPEAFKFNKLTEASINAAPSEKDVMTAFAKFVGVSPAVGHNLVRFDYKFIDKALKRHKIQSAFGWDMYDTLMIAKCKNVRSFDNMKLETISKALRIAHALPHHGLSDAIATGYVMVYFIDKYNNVASYGNAIDPSKLKHQHLVKSPVNGSELESQFITTIGFPKVCSRLEVAQFIVDQSGSYLHDALVKTTKVLTGDMEKEDEAISRCTQFASTSYKTFKATELSARPGKEVSFSGLDSFAKDYVVSHSLKISFIDFSVSASTDSVLAVDKIVPIEEVLEKKSYLPKIMRMPKPKKSTNDLIETKALSESPIKELYDLPVINPVKEKNVVLAYGLMLIPVFGVALFFTYIGKKWYTLASWIVTILMISSFSVEESSPLSIFKSISIIFLLLTLVYTLKYGKYLTLNTTKPKKIKKMKIRSAP